jgi:hypothetical protein
MTDSAGTAEAVTVDATVMPHEKAVSGRQRALGMIAYGVLAIVWYIVIRWVVVALFALPFALLPKTAGTAATWMLFVQPIGLGVGAYLTMLTNRRNRPFHTAIAVIVFASVFIGHITLGVGNDFIPRASDGLRVTAWFSQALFVLVGASVGFAKTRPKEIKIPKMLLPPKMRKAQEA